jgi:hypothetical protein
VGETYTIIYALTNLSSWVKVPFDDDNTQKLKYSRVYGLDFALVEFEERGLLQVEQCLSYGFSWGEYCAYVGLK